MFFKFFTYHFRSIISDSVGHEAFLFSIIDIFKKISIVWCHIFCTIVPNFCRLVILYHFRSIISDSVGHEADESSENEDDDDVLEAKTPVAQNYYGYNNSPEKSCYSNSIQSTPPSIRKVPPNTLKRNSFTREGNHEIYGLPIWIKY